jgi:RNA polymerase sigma-70 factor (ECF subfamily)
MSDEDIVGRVLAGETELFELLVRRHNQPLFRTARAVLGDDDAAEEALQRGYIQIWRRLETFAGRASLLSWMHRIVLRIAFEVASAERRRRSVLAAVATNQPARTADDEQPSDQGIREETAREIDAAVMSLEPAYRLVFVMRVVDGLSTAAVAETLEVNEGVVKVRLHRAREQLRGRLVAHAGIDRSTRELWRFDGARCDRITGHVLAAIARAIDADGLSSRGAD